MSILDLQKLEPVRENTNNLAAVSSISSNCF
ncbi:hypothetical protein ACVLV4_000986 [Rathayibacter agropyri]